MFTLYKATEHGKRQIYFSVKGLFIKFAKNYGIPSYKKNHTSNVNKDIGSLLSIGLLNIVLLLQLF